MAKRKPKRPYRLIGFKAYFDGDQAIIDWWESLDEGSRSNAIRDVLHTALGLNPPSRKTIMLDLAELRQDTIRIRQTLEEMPTVLERMVVQTAARQPVGVAVTTTPSPAHDMPLLNDAESRRRARKLARVSW